jgi:hypothetical protein
VDSRYTVSWPTLLVWCGLHFKTLLTSRAVLQQQLRLQAGHLEKGGDRCAEEGTEATSVDPITYIHSIIYIYTYNVLCMYMFMCMYILYIIYIYIIYITYIYNI